MNDSFKFKLPFDLVEFLKHEDALEDYLSEIKNLYKIDKDYITDVFDLNESNSSIDYSLKSNKNRISYYTIAAFSWGDTTKGVIFWSRIHKKLKSNLKINTKIPKLK